MSLTFPIAIVVSEFNEEISSGLLSGALQRLKELEFPEHQITVIKVPGAVEISIVAQRLARLERYEAIVVYGAVIRGETSHYDYVCQQVSQGCQRVALDHDIPVLFGILTTDNIDQARKRLNKGREYINSAVQMVSVLRDIE